MNLTNEPEIIVNYADDHIEPGDIPLWAVLRISPVPNAPESVNINGAVVNGRSVINAIRRIMEIEDVR